MNRPDPAGKMLALTLLFVAGAAISACLGCGGCGAGTPKPTALLPGDAGLCTTTYATPLPDGSYAITYLPCDFSKGN